uniref:Uncharacterized protein n=1 Tax=Rhizophora mucronata TaxID=61149 RepID=A0A2P2PBI3_RHIMU
MRENLNVYLLILFYFSKKLG